MHPSGSPGLPSPTDFYVDYPLIQSLSLSHNGDIYTLTAGDKVYQIGYALFAILRSFQEQKTPEEVCTGFARQYPEWTRHYFDHMLVYHLQPLLESIRAQEENALKPTYIYGRIDLLKAHVLRPVTRRLAFLCQKYVFFIVLVATGVCLWYNGFIPRSESIRSYLSIEGIMLGYALVLVTLLFHELGHATASYRYGVAPKSIGFGIYLIFPVFYTNVTHIWTLDKYKRIHINFAGVYFQMIAYCLLTLVSLLLPASAPLQPILRLVLKVNQFIALFSLNPFFRNDGYWIYCDYFNIPNLTRQSLSYPRLLFQKVWHQKESLSALVGRKEIPLFVFSLGNYAFLLFFVAVLARLLIHTTQQLYFFLSDTSFRLAQQPVWFLGKTTLVYAMLGFCVYKYLFANLFSLKRTTL